MITQAFWLIVAHFALDYPLQGDTTAREKNRHAELGRILAMAAGVAIAPEPKKRRATGHRQLGRL